MTWLPSKFPVSPVTRAACRTDTDIVSRLVDQRWYMFQNMGPAPAGRSGHSMVSWANKIYVLGGESYTAERPDDPSIVHVLDTNKIKYPTDQQRKHDSSRNTLRQSSTVPRASAPAPASPPAARPGQNEEKSRDVARQETRRAASPTAQVGQPRPSMVTVASQSGPQSSDVRAPLEVAAEARRRTNTASPVNTGPPPRPRRDDAREQAAGRSPQPPVAARAVSPTATEPTRPLNVASPSSQSIESMTSPRPISPAMRAMSPTNNFAAPAPGSPRGAVHAQAIPSPTTAAPPSLEARLVRSPSPRPGAPAEQTKPPADAFYYAPREHSDGAGERSRTLSSAGHTASQVKWLKAALAVAEQQGFVAPSATSDEDVEGSETLKGLGPDAAVGPHGQLVAALVEMKKDLAGAKVRQ